MPRTRLPETPLVPAALDVLDTAPVNAAAPVNAVSFRSEVPAVSSERPHILARRAARWARRSI